MRENGGGGGGRSRNLKWSDYSRAPSHCTGMKFPSEDSVPPLLRAKKRISVRRNHVANESSDEMRGGGEVGGGEVREIKNWHHLLDTVPYPRTKGGREGVVRQSRLLLLAQFDFTPRRPRAGGQRVKEVGAM